VCCPSYVVGLGVEVAEVRRTVVRDEANDPFSPTTNLHVKVGHVL